MRISEVRSLDQVARLEWDNLARDKSFYATWGWLRSLESPVTARMFDTRYLLARSRGGRLCGALPIFRTRGIGNRHYFPDYALHAQLPSGLRSRASWIPGLIGSSRSAFLSEILVAPDREGTEAAAMLMESLFGLEEPHEDRAAWIFHVPPDSAELLVQVVRGDVVVILGEADVMMPVPWSSFDEYLGSLSNRRRGAVRRELRDFSASGGEITVGTLEDTASTIAPLLASTLSKHGLVQNIDALFSGLRLQAGFIAGQSRVYVAHRRGRPVGFSLFFEHQGAFYARLVGFDYERSGHHEYFVLLFYEPIRDAISRGILRIHLGIGGHEAKLARGGQVRPLWCFLRHRDVDLRYAFPDLAESNFARAERFVADYGRFLDERQKRDWLLAAERMTIAGLR